MTRRVTLTLDIPNDPDHVRSDSIVEEVMELIRSAEPATRRYLRVQRVQCGAARTVDLLELDRFYEEDGR